MNRIPVVWCESPDDDDEVQLHSITFRLRDSWVATDADQLLLPVTVLKRDEQDIEPVPALLKQYGGEALLNDLLLADEELDEGTTWRITTGGSRRTIEPADLD